MNNQLSLALGFSPKYVFKDGLAQKFHEENSLHLKLRKPRQLQGIHRIEHLVEKGVKIAGKMKEEGVHSAVEGETLVETKTVLEIVCVKMNLGLEIYAVGGQAHDNLPENVFVLTH